uniref:Uncharacterized protein n=1 Tax=Aegilops tauschii subsp. strangulata TaxID=200361 RepID=A0A453JJT1_AEGTS
NRPQFPLLPPPNSGDPPPPRCSAAWTRRSRRCAAPSPRCSPTPTTPPARSPTPSPAAPSPSVPHLTSPPSPARVSPASAFPSFLLTDDVCACSLAESATNAFLQGLDRRVEAAGADLARLESMAFGTVSVEELLGHFREVHNIVSRHADAIESRLVFFGYVAPG